MKQCHKCGTEWDGVKRQPGVKECCDNCSAYLHCCLNCRFHARHAHNQCASSTADWVGDRVKANFCGEFEFADKDAAHGGAKQAEAQDALGSLFGNSLPEEKKPQSFDDLFEK